MKQSPEIERTIFASAYSFAIGDLYVIFGKFCSEYRKFGKMVDKKPYTIEDYFWLRAIVSGNCFLIKNR